MIKPIEFFPDGTVSLYHEERDHGGALVLADLLHPVDMLGRINDAFLRVPCPVSGCDSESLWPVSGGDEGQRLGVLHRVAKKGETLTKAKAEIKARAERLDGVGRFQLDDEKTLADLRKLKRIKEREMRDEDEEKERTKKTGKP